MDIEAMKNRDKWQPSKYIYKSGELIGSRNSQHVSIGSRLMTDLIAKNYDSSLQTYAKGKLLDLGCGKAPLFMAYKDLVTESICVDWANTLHKNEYLDFECDLTKPLPFADGEFNTIILSDVLEHIPQPEFLWEEISRILATNGILIMNVPFYYWIHEHPHDYYRYTEFALRRFVDNCGLTLLELESIAGVPEIMTDIFAKSILRAPRIGRALAISAQWITATFLKTRLGRRVSNATKQDFPFGYFLVAQKGASPQN